VTFSRQGKPHYKSFSDIRRGDAENAFAAAMAWRDDQLAAISTVTKRDFCQIKRRSNWSGVPGVLFITPKGEPQGAWAARIKLADGHERTKMFSVKKYGEVQTFELTRRGSIPWPAG